MSSQILLVCSLLVIAISFVIRDSYYRVSGFMTAFSLMALAITKDVTSVLVIMITGLIIHVLLLLSYKEYNKNDD